jgi:hypothetical protein
MPFREGLIESRQRIPSIVLAIRAVEKPHQTRERAEFE